VTSGEWCRPSRGWTGSRSYWGKSRRIQLTVLRNAAGRLEARESRREYQSGRYLLSVIINDWLTVRTARKRGSSRDRVQVHRTRPVTVHVTLKDGRYTGETTVKQTDFGVKPPGKAGVRAKDEVKIEFDVRLAS
jgi:hypothetical protein